MRYLHLKLTLFKFFFIHVFLQIHKQTKLTGARWSDAELLNVWDGVTKHPCRFLFELTAKEDFLMWSVCGVGMYMNKACMFL